MHRALQAISQQRCQLDAKEAYWLRQAEARQIWRELGMVSAIDYLERELGYKPRKAQERLRVARALGALLELTEALSAGQLPYSAVRELTRVATPVTEAAWRDAAVGKNLRQIEELVAEHRPGDRPEDPPDPEVRVHVVRFELSAEPFATLRQARQVLDDEHGQLLSDDELVAALSGSVLEGAPAGEPAGRAKFQIAVTICERCRQGWQDGAGVRVPIGAAAVERAMCDAQHIGSIDDDTPARAYQDVSPSVARLVWRPRERDHGPTPAARAHGPPGWRRRPRGASIDAMDDHASRMDASTASAQQAASLAANVTADVPIDGAASLALAVLRTQAKAALVRLGWKPAIALAAVTEAAAEPSATRTLDQLSFHALRRCPKPNA